MEVSKSDWKLFRARIGDWQEAYMERLVKEYMAMLIVKSILMAVITEIIFTTLASTEHM